MVLSEAALYALFMVWQKAGLGEAMAAKWVSGGNPRARAGGHGYGHGPQFFFHEVGGISEEVQRWGIWCVTPIIIGGGGNNFGRQSVHCESRWRRGTLQCTAKNTESSQCDGANVQPR